MRLSKILICLLIFSLLLSCAKKEEYPAKIAVVEGVKTITNPDYPREGNVQYAMEEDLSIGVAEGDEKYMLNMPIDINVSEDGTIYVMDWGDVCIKVYNSSGEYLDTVGREGIGPGEFSTPAYMAVSPDGRIFLLDGRNQRVSIFDREGEYLNGFRVEGFHTDLETDGMNRLYFAKRSYKEALENLPETSDFQEIETEVKVFRTDAQGKETITFGPFLGEKNRTRRTGADSSVSIGSAYSIVWSVDKDGRLYQGFNQDYIFHVFNQDGNKVLTFGREYTPVKNKRYSDRPTSLKYLPPYEPRFWGRFLDDDGNLWINIYTENDEEIVYDVFSPEGFYLKQVKVPHRIFHFKKGKAYSIVTSEEGFRVVKRFRLKEIKGDVQ